MGNSAISALQPEDFLIGSRKKGIMVFALPGEPGLTELTGDFKIHFHDRQGDFYCWLNTTMMANREVLDMSDLDGFDKRSLSSPGFQVEIVMIDYDGSVPRKSKNENASGQSSSNASGAEPGTGSKPDKGSEDQNKDDVFSDSESEDNESSRRNQTRVDSSMEPVDSRSHQY